MTSLQQLIESAILNLAAQAQGTGLSGVQTAAAAGFGIAAVMAILAVSLTVFVFFSFCSYCS